MAARARITSSWSALLALGIVGQWIVAPVAAQPAAPAASQTTPSIDELISVKRVGAPAISPDGRVVAYTVRETNWDTDAFETEIWIVDAATGEARQLTNSDKSSSAPAWSPDSRSIAFLSDRGGKQQVYLIDPRGGEARLLVGSKQGVSQFAWSPDGRRIAYTENNAVDRTREERDKRYGEFEIVDEDHVMTQLHVVDVIGRHTRALTRGAFSVGRFDWSPDGTAIAFDHRINNDPANGGSADISIVTLDAGANENERSSVRPLVTQEGPDANPIWSPDGTHIAFESAMANSDYYYKNRVIATVSVEGGQPANVTPAFDENPSLVEWGRRGLLLSASLRTDSLLYFADPRSGTITKLGPDAMVASSFSPSADLSRIAFIGSDARTFPEIFLLDTTGTKPRKLTDIGSQIKSWAIGTRELVTWKSQDGTEIEGVLHKPSQFEPGLRYPLLVVIHGGPTGTSRPTPLSSSTVYPIELWLAKGALILEPNYRGSAGYGEKFRSLNVRNLGIGDAWDVVSGIDHLVSSGLVDPNRVGAMGWSQGGYISAFLTTHDSRRFKAISVGAGISNWMTYYVNTDIHPFTRQYLKATPWDDAEIYAKTSPMTYVKQAQTPTLIQHGEKDQRVPPPNAYELYQGLQDQGVPVRLIIYKGFGHGLNKPKAQRAAMEHNWSWFGRHLWGEIETTEGIQ